MSPTSRPIRIPETSRVLRTAGPLTVVLPQTSHLASNAASPSDSSAGVVAVYWALTPALRRLPAATNVEPNSFGGAARASSD
ncbi:hypothetical protein [Halogeometricum limi]|uniref:hypothetical protein n=1 Tax=Halogeometricum limi TaxID=555875 RepID=UPI000B7E094C|nr:hypothetical protein [Halogeometricum limi]